MSTLRFSCKHQHGDGYDECKEKLRLKLVEIFGDAKVRETSTSGLFEVEGEFVEAQVQEKIGPEDLAWLKSLQMNSTMEEPQLIYQIEGISCLDCLEKFRSQVEKVETVKKAEVNPLLGELIITGHVKDKELQKLAQVEGYKLSLKKGQSQSFIIEGISCLDCAGEFERAVNRLPGVREAVLNTMTGELKVDGVVQLEELQKLGDSENYRIRSGQGATVVLLPTQLNQAELLRAAGAAGLWVAAFLLGWQGLESYSIPVYAAAILIGGWSNFFKAFRAIKQGAFNMAVLMSVAVAGAALLGEWQEGAAVASLFALAEYLEEWSVEKGRQALSTLVSLTPSTAHRLTEGEEVEVSIEELIPGDRIRIRPGEQIPSDGKVVVGGSAIVESAITGEPLPVEKTIGDTVFAGTLNTHGVLEVEVEKAAADTTLSKIIRLVSQAQTQRAPVEQLVERFAAKYTPLVLIIAALIALVPPLFLGGDWHQSIYQALALLVVACPCALVISTPMTIISAVTRSAKNGVLIKAGTFLEVAANLDTIALDKTGTITQGQPKVSRVRTIAALSENELLAKLSSVEIMSDHPLSKAVMTEMETRNLSFEEAKDVKVVLGRGITGWLDGKEIYAGNSAWLEELEIAFPKELQISPEATPIWVIEDRQLLGLVEVADPLREETPQIIRELKGLGITSVLLTGDRQETAEVIAREAGIDRVEAHLLPEEKLLIVEEMKKEGLSVGMVGDGINDAPALATANLGIAVGSGTDTAIETADVVMMDGTLKKLPFFIRVSKEALNLIKQNITIAIGLKVLAILAAFFGVLTLWIAILADIGATFIVTLNSLRILQKK